MTSKQLEHELRIQLFRSANHFPLLSEVTRAALAKPKHLALAIVNSDALSSYCHKIARLPNDVGGVFRGPKVCRHAYKQTFAIKG